MCHPVVCMFIYPGHTFDIHGVHLHHVCLSKETSIYPSRIYGIRLHPGHHAVCLSTRLSIQAILATFTASTSLLPGVAAAVLGTLATVLNRGGALPVPLATLWSSMGGWAATLLFMFQPLAQLVCQSTYPSIRLGRPAETCMQS
jgi:hypothetical protein